MNRRGFLALLGLTSAATVVSPSSVFNWDPVLPLDAPLAGNTFAWMVHRLAAGLAERYGPVEGTSASKMGMTTPSGIVLTNQLSLDLGFQLPDLDGLTVAQLESRYVDQALEAYAKAFKVRQIRACGELDLPPSVEKAYRATSRKEGWSVRGIYHYSLKRDFEGLNPWVTQFDVLVGGV